MRPLGPLGVRVRPLSDGAPPPAYAVMPARLLVQGPGVQHPPPDTDQTSRS